MSTTNQDSVQLIQTMQTEHLLTNIAKQNIAPIFDRPSFLERHTAFAFNKRAQRIMHDAVINTQVAFKPWAINLPTKYQSNWAILINNWVKFYDDPISYLQLAAVCEQDHQNMYNAFVNVDIDQFDPDSLIPDPGNEILEMTQLGNYLVDAYKLELAFIHYLKKIPPQP